MRVLRESPIQEMQISILSLFLWFMGHQWARVYGVKVCGCIGVCFAVFWLGLGGFRWVWLGLVSGGVCLNRARSSGVNSRRLTAKLGCLQQGRQAGPHPSSTRNQASETSSIQYDESSRQDFVHLV